MNWTGGRLQRHSGPADTALARQKQHFARVKANLLNGKKGTPKKGTLTDGREEEIHRSSPRWSAARLAEIERLQKSDTEDFQHDRVDKHESKDVQRSSRRKQIGDGRKALHGIASNGRQYDSGGDRHKHLQHSPRLSSKSSRKYPSSYFGDPSNLVLSAQIKKEPAPDDDLYNATPPPFPEKREREESERLSNPENHNETEAEQSISSKKRKLMLKADWVGVGFQRPPRVAFVPPRNQDNVAKRRKITDGHQARYGTKQAVIGSPFVKKRRQALAEQLSSQPSPKQTPARNDVRISIGGRVVPPGISSSSVHSRRHGNQHTLLSDRPHTRSSDVMLLDNEPMNNCGVNSHRLLTTEVVRYYDDDGNYSLYQHPGIPAHYHPDLVTSSRAGSRSIGSQGNRSRDAEGIQQSKYIQDSAQERNILPRGRRHTEPDPQSDETYSSRGLRRIRSEDVNLKRPRSGPSTPVYSSSVSLHHPKPQSSRVSSILRSESADIVGSTLAQVGREKPVVPNSQILDNEIWESWLAPLQPQNGEVDEEETTAKRRISISPGISAASTYKPSIGEISSNAAFDTSRWESPEPYEGDSEEGGFRASLSPFDNELLEVSVPRTEANLEDGGPIEVAELSWTLPESPSKLSAPPKPLVDNMKLPIASKQEKEEDHDDVWKKFVFGAGSDEDEMKPKPVPAVPAEGAKFCSLMRAHLAAVNSAQPKMFSSLHHPGDIATPKKPSGSSFITSRKANSSPSDPGSGSKYGHLIATSTESLSAGEAEDSARASGGSLHSWGSNSGLATVAATVAATAAPCSSPRSGSDGDTSGFRMQKRVTCTKPKPFVGSKAKLESSSAVDEPVEFWRGLMGGGNRKELTKKCQDRKRNIINLIESNDERVEIESIEDD